MIYEYVVFYSWVGETGYGYGRVDIKRNLRIKSIDDIEGIEKDISNEFGLGSVVISNYILLKKTYWYI